MSRPRLKGYTGCLTCRRRRKKCDELRPVCINCARNSFSCSWPKASPRVGITSRRQLRASSPPSSEILPSFVGDTSSDLSSCAQTRRLAIASSLPRSLSINLFESETESQLFQYCTDLFLPSQEHYQAGFFYAGESYMVYISINYRPLLDAMMACAAATLSGEVDWFRNFAVKKYISAVQGVQDGLASGSLVGKEDHLLATVAWLCVFENLRCDGPTKMKYHLQAMSALLHLRTPMDRNNSAAPALAFERMCVESFIHHSATILLVDGSTDLVCDVQQLVKKFEACFTNRSPSITESWLDKLQNSLVLGPLPDVFVTLMQVTNQAPSAGPLDEASVNNIHHQDCQILDWGQYLQSNSVSKMWEGKLYMHAIRALILRDIHTRHKSTSKFHTFGFRQSIIQGLHILKMHTLQAPFEKYYLLPLAVLGSVLTSEEDVAVIREKFNVITESSNSSTGRHIREILEEIWKTQVGSTENFVMEGLGEFLHSANIGRSTSDL